MTGAYYIQRTFMKKNEPADNFDDIAASGRYFIAKKMNSLIKAASGSYIGKNDPANNFDDSIAASGSSMKNLNSPIISMIAVRSACVSKDRFYTFYYLVPVALK
jgi:hypothetical protein